MNETVFAQIQLNGADDISNAWTSETVNLDLPSALSVREPYFKRENNYMYMYVGVGSGEAVELRVKNADNANRAAVLHYTYIGSTSSGAKDKTVISTQRRQDVSSNKDLDDAVLSISDGVNGARALHITKYGIYGWSDNPSSPAVMQNFNIRLSQNNSIKCAEGTGAYVENVHLKKINHITLSKTYSFGTAQERDKLTATATEGQLFFVIV